MDGVPKSPEDDMRPSEILHSMPPAGFWRRVLGFGIDFTILVIVGQLVVGQLVASRFASFLYDIGPYGRFFGWPIVLAYFTSLTAVGAGQTFGQMVVKTATRAADGHLLRPRTAFLRALLLSLVIIPPITLLHMSGFVAYWLIMCTAYLLLFNRGTRQLPHDLFTRSNVFHLKGKRLVAMSRVWQGHLVVMALLSMAPVYYLWFPMPTLPGILGQWQTRINGMQSLVTRWDGDPRAFSLHVQQQEWWVKKREGHEWQHLGHTVDLTVWYRGSPDSLNESDKRALWSALAGSAIELLPDLQQSDGLKVGIMSAIDIGLATRFVRYVCSDSVANWRTYLYSQQDGKSPPEIIAPWIRVGSSTESGG